MFGAPLERQRKAEIRKDAVSAVQCALEMERALIALNRKWEAENRPMVGMRAGIYTGSVAAGSLGGGDRLEYTVHGDAVNIAARLEGFERSQFKPDFLACPCRLLIGDTTFSYLDEAFETVFLGEIFLKGKRDKLKVFQVFSPSVKKTGEGSQNV